MRVISVNPLDPWLTKYQRNDLFRAVEASSVPITEFELREYGQLGNNPTALIRHPNSKSVFGIRRLEKEQFEVRTAVGRNKDEERLFLDHTKGSIGPWSGVTRLVKAWIREIKKFIQESERYAATPDLWDELYRAKDYLMRQSERFENTPLTNVERTSISVQIEQVKAYIITTHELTSEQISRIDARLDHADEASRRMGRKDWLVLFNGAVFSLILTDLITPQTAQHVILMTIYGLSHLFGIGGPPQLPFGE
jgi:hypothetical protein